MQRSETAPKRWWLLVALGFFAFMTNLDGSIVNIAVPIMAKDLKSSGQSDGMDGFAVFNRFKCAAIALW